MRPARAFVGVIGTIALATGGLARPAHAEGIGVIAVSRGDRAPVASALARASAGRSARVVEDAVGEARAAHAAGAVPVEALAAFRRVRDIVDEGWRAYLRVAVEVAASRLTTARTDAEALVALPGGAELYADAALRLGAVLDHLGRTQDAQAVLALAIALDPGRPITLAEFSPDIVDAVAAARAAPVALERVAITTSPAGALIRVDGKDVGRAPLEVQLTRGQHLVVARAPQHAPRVQGLRAGTTTLEIVLEPDEDAVRLDTGAAMGMPDAQAQALVDATLRFADLDEVVVVSDTVRRGGPVLLVQRCAGIPARCTPVTEVGYGDPAGLASAATGAWAAVRAAALGGGPTVLGEREGVRDDGRCRACRSPWLWTGVGAAVVAGTVLAIIATSATRAPPTVTIDGGAFVGGR